jgi:hypothetical protein
VGLLVYGAFTVVRFASLMGQPKSTYHSWEIVFWTLGAATLVFGEYWLIDHGYIEIPQGQDKKEEYLKSTKIYADYASKIWAAVLAVATFLFAR